ncbi:MAG: sigma-70 family RNA polymerase sigma factor [candidate division Zixibacteria bacterium]|nr:sigma-70 family RNA polymerase sigma factor [candidate division Zixibacteria bacterium]
MPETDLELVNKFQAGDERAFDQLVVRHQTQIINLTYKMTRDLETARDVAQDVFLKAYNGLLHFKGQSSFNTWLYRIALNTCINHTRALKFKNLLSIFEASLPASNWGNPESDLRKERVGREIDDAVLSLPPRQRQIFVLRHYQDLSYNEIAQMTGKSEGALKANYFQAVRKLQKKLNHLL